MSKPVFVEELHTDVADVVAFHPTFDVFTQHLQAAGYSSADCTFTFGGREVTLKENSWPFFVHQYQTDSKTALHVSRVTRVTRRFASSSAQPQGDQAVDPDVPLPKKAKRPGETHKAVTLARAVLRSRAHGVKIMGGDYAYELSKAQLTIGTHECVFVQLVADALFEHDAMRRTWSLVRDKLVVIPVMRIPEWQTLVAAKHKLECDIPVAVAMADLSAQFTWHDGASHMVQHLEVLACDGMATQRSPDTPVDTPAEPSSSSVTTLHVTDPHEHGATLDPDEHTDSGQALPVLAKQRAERIQKIGDLQQFSDMKKARDHASTCTNKTARSGPGTSLQDIRVSLARVRKAQDTPSIDTAQLTKFIDCEQWAEAGPPTADDIEQSYGGMCNALELSLRLGILPHDEKWTVQCPARLQSTTHLTFEGLNSDGFRVESAYLAAELLMADIPDAVTAHQLYPDPIDYKSSSSATRSPYSFITSTCIGMKYDLVVDNEVAFLVKRSDPSVRTETSARGVKSACLLSGTSNWLLLCSTGILKMSHTGKITTLKVESTLSTLDHIHFHSASEGLAVSGKAVGRCVIEGDTIRVTDVELFSITIREAVRCGDMIYLATDNGLMKCQDEQQSTPFMEKRKKDCTLQEAIAHVRDVHEYTVDQYEQQLQITAGTSSPESLQGPGDRTASKELYARVREVIGDKTVVSRIRGLKKQRPGTKPALRTQVEFQSASTGLQRTTDDDDKDNDSTLVNTSTTTVPEADDEDDDGGLNDSTVSLSACHHRQAADIVITAVRRWSVPCTSMETVSQLVVSSVVAGMCTEGCTGTSCTTASHPTDSHGHCTFAASTWPHLNLPHHHHCHPSLHAAGFKQLTALDAVGSWTTTPGSKEAAIVFLVRMHVLANVAQERFLDYDNDSVPFMKNILQHANDRQYRMLRGLWACLFARTSSAAQIEEDDPQPTYIHTRVPGSRASPNSGATENCISVFVKIAHGLSEMLTHLLDWLSITEDDDEAKYIFTCLVEVLQARQDPRVTAPESPVIGTPAAAVNEPHCPGHVHSLINMQDSPAHGVLGQLMQDPQVHARVQCAVEALSSSA
ncbi:hypothetical protein PTSG_05793 [Salpingoeca rosetta]|uniref:Uncharacterized protein n=1 Tax=Salpingoeca rosetta (strain ATCC 50818 / BSB-021) TaxID=946362 RepID=F2UCT4_SALR5|nr:uncharacterized protein PTSG_05793 [Salpingoeca rosetta]EGD74429.1 hypothetical protein PTSG_05793 [Salpingoeca rosetta]|eukprot:XP_004992686.1 hypothetical protein PTSG_05793 [Salpingoeca rosetta]